VLVLAEVPSTLLGERGLELAAGRHDAVRCRWLRGGEAALRTHVLSRRALLPDLTN
jgi:hypothetical protein